MQIKSIRKSNKPVNIELWSVVQLGVEEFYFDRGHYLRATELGIIGEGSQISTNQKRESTVFTVQKYMVHST